MSTSVARRDEPAQMLERVVVEGDLSKLSASDRVNYYQAVCKSLGLNPLTRPFQYLRLSGRLTLYASKDATDQLRKLHGISISITSRETIGDIYTVVARATTPDGRTDESLGAVPLNGLKGEALANAIMKAEAKAKRRATLSIVGLGWTDATEIDSIPAAEPVEVDPVTGEITEPAEPSLYDQAVDLLRQRGLTAKEADLLAAKAAENGDPTVLAKLAKISLAKLRSRAAELREQQAEAEQQAAAEAETEQPQDVDDEIEAEFAELFQGPEDPDEDHAEVDLANPAEPKATTAQQRKLYALCRSLEKAGITESAWRSVILQASGQQSRSELTKEQASLVIQALQQMLDQNQEAA